MRRFLSSVLVMVILSTTCLTACSNLNKKRRNEYVQKSEWFNTTICSTQEYKNVATMPSFSPFIYSDGNSIVLYEEFGDPTGKTVASNISTYARSDNGSYELTNSLDLLEAGVVYTAEYGMVTQSVIGFFTLNDNIYAVVRYEDYTSTSIDKKYFIQIDLENNCIAQTFDDDIYSEYLNKGADAPMCLDGENLYTLTCQYPSYIITKFDENLELAYSEEIDELEWSDGIIFVGSMGDNKLFISYYSHPDYETSFAVFDTVTKEFTAIDNPPAELYSGRLQEINNQVIYSDSKGLHRYNYETNSVEYVLDYNFCNIDRSSIDYSYPAYVSDDFTVMVAPKTGDHTYWYELTIIERAESNPNEGKTILKVADISGYINPLISRAIYEFNNSNNDVYFVIDDRYNIEDYKELVITGPVKPEFGTSDEYKSDEMNAANSLSNKLLIDIMAGDGPDIILDAYNYKELNNSDYLLNLKPLLLDGTISEEDYLPAVFGSDEELYQLPLYLTARGIIWKEEYADKVGDGFNITYDEYLTLIDECCNGKDPISDDYGQLQYFVLLFNTFSNRFIHDGKIDINNDDFRALAEFAATRQPDINATFNQDDMQEDALLDNWMNVYWLNHHVATGLPSSTGTSGITYNCILSIAVSTSCPMQDVAVEFVKSILIADNDITIEGVREMAEKEVEDTNYYIENFDPYEDPEYFLLDEGDIEAYMAVMTASTDIVNTDSSISVIVYEEIQAYFAGDKTLDEIIPIIEDRCTTVLNERR